MQVTEEQVIGAARMRAIHEGTDETVASINAAQAIRKLKETLKGDDYQEALEKLYRQYADG